MIGLADMPVSSVAEQGLDEGVGAGETCAGVVTLEVAEA